MNKCRINIVIIEPSDIICEGLTNLLLKSKSHYYALRISSLDEFNRYCQKEKVDAVIVNPIVLINRTNEFLKLKKRLRSVTWIGIVYTYFEHEMMPKLDDIITIGEPSEQIIDKINGAIQKCNCQDSRHNELSERESAVLVLLTKGLSNKEIADQLNISVHTVISHRKNIIEKTGIKSLPGLTIYAISKKIIPLDS